MSHIRTLSALLTIAIAAACASPDPISFPPLSGPYLGQEPPGLEAEPFAAGIISKDG